MQYIIYNIVYICIYFTLIFICALGCSRLYLCITLKKKRKKNSLFPIYCIFLIGTLIVIMGMRWTTTTFNLFPFDRNDVYRILLLFASFQCNITTMFDIQRLIVFHACAMLRVSVCILYTLYTHMTKWKPSSIIF